MQVVPEAVEPAGEVLPPSGRTRSSLCRNRLVCVAYFGEPLFDAFAIIFGFLPRHLPERRDEVLPADHLRCDLQVFGRHLRAVIKRVSGEEAEVLKRDQGHVTIPDRRVEYERAVFALDRPQQIL